MKQLLFQAYQTLPNYTDATGQEGLGMLFTYVSTIVPAFIPLTLFALFIITGIGSFILQEKFKGRGDFPASIAAASVLVALTAILMTLVEGLIGGEVVIITIVLAIVSVIWLAISKD